MKRKPAVPSMKAKKAVRRNELKKQVANAIEMKLVEIKTSHRKIEMEHTHLSLFRYAR